MGRGLVAPVVKVPVGRGCEFLCAAGLLRGGGVLVTEDRVRRECVGAGVEAPLAVFRGREGDHHGPLAVLGLGRLWNEERLG